MKILLINKFHYLKGGSETYYFGLGDMLKKAGHEVIWFAMKDPQNVPCAQEQYFVDNVDFNAPMSKVQMAKAGFKMLYSFEAKKKLEALIEAEHPDVAHINLFQSQLTGSIVDVLYKHHIPIVYTMHDLKPICPTYLMMCNGQICSECAGGHYMPCIKKHCMKNSLSKSVLAAAEARLYNMKKTYDRMNVIVTPSEHHRQKLLASGATKTEVVMLRNFLPDYIRFADTVEAGSYFLFFGRLSNEKGLLTLIRAYAQSGVEHPLYLAGRGEQQAALEALIESLGMQQKVKLLGFHTGEDLQNIVKGARCVLMPSECAENAPYSLIEAMAAGRPVIVSRNGGLPEIVSEGENGYISKPGNADDLAEKICQFDAMSEELLIQMGAASQKLAKEKFDREEYLKQIVEIYQKCLTNRS